jgi:5-methylcytosine-specific restriction endonuclease McrA
VRDVLRKNAADPERLICARCGGHTQSDRKYCSKCSPLVTKAIRKKAKIARRYRIKYSQMQTIVDVDQFIRDGWRCRMCDCEVDQIPPVTKDNFAHLDHIYPLSKGGQHLLSNVQTLCRKCNLNKRDHIQYETIEVKAG